MSDRAGFNSLGMAGWVLRLCEKIGYRAPTLIQSLAIKAILQGKNVIANAETGSGKTAAFALPLLQRLAQDPYGVFCLVVTPSRELAIQIHEQFEIFGQSLNLRQALLIGGIGFADQEHQLDSIPHIVVGTPGRISHMLTKNETFRKYIKNCSTLVLDEADRLFEDTLLVEMQDIFAMLPHVKQFVLATATIDNNFEAKRLKEILQQEDVVFEKYTTYDRARTVDTLIQKYMLVPQVVKPGYLVELLKKRQGYKIIIFVKQCKQCHLLHSTLKRMEFKTCMLHSFMKQTRRFANLSLFRSGKADILVTTDLASRGLDIKAVDLVINFEIPRKLSDYIHRVGRTARKGMEGEAVTFVTQNEVNLFLELQKNLQVKMEQEKLSEDSAIENFRVYSKALRQSKLQLSNKGVLEQLDSLAEKKKQSRDELHSRGHSLP